MQYLAGGQPCAMSAVDPFVGLLIYGCLEPHWLGLRPRKSAPGAVLAQDAQGPGRHGPPV